MRWGLLVVCLVSCGKVEKLTPDASAHDAATHMDAPLDAPTDAAVTSVMLSSPQGPTTIDAEGDTAMVSVHVHTTVASQTVNVAFTSSLGTYNPPSVAMTTDATGNGIATATYTSSSAGTEMTSMVATLGGVMSAPATLSFSVAPLARYGYPTPYTVSGGFAPNYLLGESIQVAAAGHLKKLGFNSLTAGPNIQIAVYTDAGGGPGTLVAQLGSTAIQMGVNEVAITPTALAAGNYWFEAVYSASGSVSRDATSGTNVIDYISFTFGGAPPSPFPAPTSYMAGHFNYYLVVGQ